MTPKIISEMQERKKIPTNGANGLAGPDLSPVVPQSPSQHSLCLAIFLYSLWGCQMLAHRRPDLAKAT